MKRFYLSRLVLLVVLLSGWNSRSMAQLTTFNLTSNVQYYTVPAGVTSVAVDMQGASGGKEQYNNSGMPGAGGRVQCTIAVTPGAVLNVYVGGRGSDDICCSGVTGGYNGGANTQQAYSAGGGGASDIRINGSALSNRVAVAGGGGGAGYGCCCTSTYGSGGDGGGLTGNTGYYCNSNSNPCYNGQGGTQTAGGAAGTCGCNGAGTLGNGGIGGSCYYGGGGGGGYYGGGGAYGGGGGGGSSYTDAVLCSNVTLTASYNPNSNGVVSICPGPIMGSISGSHTVCPAGVTTPLTDVGGTPGGVWSSSNPGVALVNAATGVVTGVTGGVTTISYTVTGSCATGSTIFTMTVLPKPTLYDLVGGGTLCAGATGVDIATDGSDLGVTYNLYSGSTLISSKPGTGSAIDYGITTTAGTYVDTAITSAGCKVQILGTATVVVNPLPNVYTLTIGGVSTGTVTYCAGGTAYHPLLSTSDVGITYQLNLGGIPIPGASMSGTGSLLDFGPQPAAGIYTITATNNTTGCFRNMNGNPAIGINPLPTAFPMSGGGHYCSGGTGTLMGLTNSTTGISYQLYDGPTAEGLPVAGSTGSAISFGLQTASGTYTVLATNTSTFCTNTMSGTKAITIDPLPNVYTITGGGNYCAGGIGVDISLSGSDAGVKYQLYDLGVIVPGALKTGSGGTVDFGNLTPAGNYTIVANNPSTTCSNNMAGSVNVVINPLPAIDTVLGGGGYCSGGAGRDVSLSFSNTGVNYQLYNGLSSVGGLVAGTGFPLDFLTQPAGDYTVKAQNATTGCFSTMFGDAKVTMNALPNPYLVTGAGSYCAMGVGLPVGLNNSDLGVSYQLYNMGSPVPPIVSGTGKAISFGNQTLAGGYTVVATTGGTGCQNNMTGSVTMNINPLPTVFNVTGGGGYCSGGSGLAIGLDSTETGVSYQLYNGPTKVGSAMPGINNPISFGVKGTVGTYTVNATNTTTTCSTNMNGSATITINPLPTAYTVSGGGNYCTGSTGKDVWLSFSNTGISYQLYYNGNPIGAPAIGLGGVLDFGIQSGLGNYTVQATNIISGCTNWMTGSVNITTSPNPTPFTVSGAGGYCAGAGGSDVTISGSVPGVSYQLMFNGTTPVGLPKSGTSHAIDFGSQIIPGNYTVVATTAVTGCTAVMPGMDSVFVNPAPTPYTIAGGGAYCTGGSGSDISLSFSDIGTTYVLVPAGISMPGTGSPLDYGFITTTGVYSVLATTGAGCTGVMPGTAVISTLPLPTVYTVTGGGNYCAGGTGYHVMLSGSNTGVSYQITAGSGISLPGTGKSLDYGLQTAAGSYQVIATDTKTGCTNTMASSATIGINPLPTIDTVTGGGAYCAGSISGLHVGLNTAQAGINYQLYISGLKSGGTKPGLGTVLDFGLETAGGNYTVMGIDAITGCSVMMADTAKILINPKVVPMVTASSDLGTTVCASTATSFTATPTNGGSSPMYQWYLNSVAVAGATNSTFVDTSINTDAVSVVLTSNAMCALPANATSNTVTMTVNPITIPSVSLLLDPAGDSVCKGTIVKYTAVPHNAGLSPTYAWTLSGAPVGNDITNTITINASAQVAVTITSNDPCVNPADTTATATENMVVVQPVAPTVAALTVKPGKTIAQGQIDTVIATITGNGGPNPTYEWQINGVTVPGQTSNMLIGNNLYGGVTFNNHDSITCIVTGSGLCGGNQTAKSVTLTIRNTTGINQITALNSDVRIIPNPNKGAFVIKGNVGANDDQEVYLEITNMLGQTVYKNTVTALNGNLNEQVQLNNSLANGMYILNVRSGSENSAFHFVIEQ